jgi:hypothetical protein
VGYKGSRRALRAGGLQEKAARCGYWRAGCGILLKCLVWLEANLVPLGTKRPDHSRINCSSRFEEMTYDAARKILPNGAAIQSALSRGDVKSWFTRKACRMYKMVDTSWPRTPSERDKSRRFRAATPWSETGRVYRSRPSDIGRALESRPADAPRVHRRARGVSWSRRHVSSSGPMAFGKDQGSLQPSTRGALV